MGAKYGGSACTPHPGAAGSTAPPESTPVDLPFFPGHSLQAAALTWGLLTRGSSAGTRALCISGAVSCVAGASRAAEPASAAVPVTAERAACLG